jgi:hypothetical protein
MNRWRWAATAATLLTAALLFGPAAWSAVVIPHPDTRDVAPPLVIVGDPTLTATMDADADADADPSVQPAGTASVAAGTTPAPPAGASLTVTPTSAPSLPSAPRTVAPDTVRDLDHDGESGESGGHPEHGESTTTEPRGAESTTTEPRAAETSDTRERRDATNDR